MAYDSRRSATVLFGGLFETNTNLIWYPDTWELHDPASASVFGVGCGSPQLAAIPVPGARPVIGTTAAVSLANVPTPLSFIALGWSRTNLGPIPLPASLAAFGMSGCNLLQSVDEAWHPTLPTGPGTSSYSLAVPNLSGLVGLRVYLQGWSPAPGQSLGNAIVSNGIEWIIGSS